MQAAVPTTQTLEPWEHLVQFYEADPAAWAKSVGRFLADGPKRGEAVLVIATPEHQSAISKQINILGCHPGQVAFRDAAGALARFMVAAEPDWARFNGFFPPPSVGDSVLMARW
jgi:hypothetical protein